MLKRFKPLREPYSIVGAFHQFAQFKARKAYKMTNRQFEFLHCIWVLQYHSNSLVSRYALRAVTRMHCYSVDRFITVLHKLGMITEVLPINSKQHAKFVLSEQGIKAIEMFDNVLHKRMKEFKEANTWKPIAKYTKNYFDSIGIIK